MKRVYSSYNQALVYHASNLLTAHGIEVQVRNAALSSAFGELPAVETELWVMNDSDAENAERILAAAPAMGPDWKCDCGETVGQQFTQCWRCGAQRP